MCGHFAARVHFLGSSSKTGGKATFPGIVIAVKGQDDELQKIPVRIEAENPKRGDLSNWSPQLDIHLGAEVALARVHLGGGLTFTQISGCRSTAEMLKICGGGHTAGRLRELTSRDVGERPASVNEKYQVGPVFPRGEGGVG